MGPGPLIALLGALAGAAPGPAEVSLSWRRLGPLVGEGEAVVAGLSAAALACLPAGEIDAATGERLLRVVVSSEATAPEAAFAALPNLWGTWRVSEGTLAFRPRHVLAEGTVLRAVFDGRAFAARTGAGATPDRMLELRVPTGDGVTEVVGVAPSADELPENLLRLYVEFSRSMSLRGIERHVHLLDGRGEEIAAPFVEVPGGLWDPGRRRLTLLLHPGRVKHGLAMRQRLGPVLQRGESVTLTVDAAALDAEGRALARGFARTWRVGPARAAALDPERWSVLPPATRDAPLVVRLLWMVDHAIAARAFSVVDGRGEPVAASLASPDDRVLRFYPRTGWRAAETYRLRVEAFLEDPSGNRIGRPFEAEGGSPVAGGRREIPFVPLGPPAQGSARSSSASAVASRTQSPTAMPRR